MIRLATPDDLPALWPLVKAYVDETRVQGGFASEDQVAAFVCHAVGEGEAVVVAEQDGQLVGFVAWARTPGAEPDAVTAAGTYVVPAWREKKVASQMRELAKEHCRARGYRRVDGAVLRGNDAGLNSASSSGARIVGSLIRWDL